MSHMEPLAEDIREMAPRPGEPTSWAFHQLIHDTARAIDRGEFTLSAAALSEGFCPYGHQGEPAELHGVPVLTCPACECSWLIDTEGRVWGMACVPGNHTCSEGGDGDGQA